MDEPQEPGLPAGPPPGTPVPLHHTAIDHGEIQARSVHALMLAMFFVALAVRLAYVLAMRNSLFFEHLTPGARFFDAWAWDWAQGRWDAGGRAFPVPPLYSLWLSLVYRVLGHDLLLARVAQVIFGAGTVAAIAGSAARISGGGAGLAAGLLASIYGTLIFYEAELAPAALVAGLVAWALFFLTGRPSIRRCALAGGALGLAAIGEPRVLVLVPLAAALVSFRMRTERGTLVRGLAGAGLVLVVALAPAAMVTVQNARQEGTWVFISGNAGLRFYAGQHALASGRGMEVPALLEVPGGGARAERSREIAEAAVGRPLSTREASNWWFHRGLDAGREQRGAAFSRTMRKLYYLINAYEVPDERSLYAERWGVLRVLIRAAPWGAFPWGILFPLAVVGLVGGLAIGRLRFWVLFVSVWGALFGLTLLPVYVNSAERLVLAGPLLVLAGIAVGGWVPWRRNRAAVAAGVGALLLANSSLADVRGTQHSRELAALADGFFVDRSPDDAVTVLEGLHHKSPGSVATTYLLAEAYRRQDRWAEAAPFYETVVQEQHEEADAWRGLGWVLLRQGEFEAAATALETTCRLRPQDAGSFNALGSAYAGQGKPRRAAAAYTRALRMTEHDPESYLLLGQLYLRNGDLADAVRVLEAGVRRIQTSFDLRYWLSLAYIEENRLDRALEEVDIALHIRPEDTGALRLQHWLSTR